VSLFIEMYVMLVAVTKMSMIFDRSYAELHYRNCFMFTKI
jgi:hypothetical protein